MSQFDFGVIDPYVVDGVQLADDLNQFRDALLSYHRGGVRPAYVVPGMLWINDAGGPTNWILNVYLSPTIGDAPLFTYNTTTGAVTVSAAAGGTVAAAVLLAQAAASPSVQWNATGNPIDAKAWRMTVNGAGALVLSSYSDAGVLQNSLTFNRDGSIITPNMWRRLGRIVPIAAQPTVDFPNLPADINNLEFQFDVTPTTNGQDFMLRFFDQTGAIDAAGPYGWASSAVSHTQVTGSAPSSAGSAGVGFGFGILFDYAVTNRNVGNVSGIRGRGTVSAIREAARFKGVDFQSNYVTSDLSQQLAVAGSGYRGVNGLITGLRFAFINTSTFAAGGAITLWGSP
jgi:hypothetical protein